MSTTDEHKLITYCPLCDARDNRMQAHILHEDSEQRLVHVTCKKCQNAVVAVVLRGSEGASSVGLVTDLSVEDVIRFASAGSVSVDDVIDAHTFFSSDAWRARFLPKKTVSSTRKRAKTPTKGLKKKK